MTIHEQLFEHTVRIGNMWPFPVGPLPKTLAEELESQEQLPEALNSLISSWSDEEKDQLFAGEADASDSFDELCASAFRRGVKGWIGVAEVPVFKPHQDGNGATFSWGHYRLKLLFSETAEGLLEAALEWGKQQYREALTKAGAGS